MNCRRSDGMTTQLCCAALFAMMSGVTNAQTNATIPLTFQDAEGHRHTITLGVDPRATYGFDAELGEQPIPPLPAVPAFDIRFLDPQGRKQYAGDAAYIDIRGYMSATQKDTFYVHFQPANGRYPMQVSWPEEAVRRFESARMEMREQETIRSVDMMKSESVTVMSGNNLIIVTTGPKPSGKEMIKRELTR